MNIVRQELELGWQMMMTFDNLEVMVGEVKVVEVAVKGKSSIILFTHAAHHFALLIVATLILPKGNRTGCNNHS